LVCENDLTIGGSTERNAVLAPLALPSPQHGTAFLSIDLQIDAVGHSVNPEPLVQLPTEMASEREFGRFKKPSLVIAWL